MTDVDFEVEYDGDVSIGPVWDTKRPTGFGVKLLVDFVLNAKKGSYNDK